MIVFSSPSLSSLLPSSFPPLPDDFLKVILQQKDEEIKNSSSKSKNTLAYEYTHNDYKQSLNEKNNHFTQI